MSESRLFDEITRIIADPMPRRQAVRRIIAGLIGGTLAMDAWPRRAQALANTCKKDSDCGSGRYCCNSKICCNGNQVCCGTPASPICCQAGYQCVDGKCKKQASPR